MKKFLMALAMAAVVSAPVLAGPNAGGVLIVHDTGITYTNDLVEPVLSDSTFACTATDNQIDLGAERVWKVFAAFPVGSTPRLKAVAWGIYFPPNGAGYVKIEAAGSPHPVTDFSILQNGFPFTSGGGIGTTFIETHTAPIDELYWFGGFAYGGPLGTDAQTFATGPHPVQTSMFVDDAVPPQKDPIAGYGSIGFGQAGVTPCPESVVPGACCFPDGSCQMLDPTICLQTGGTSFGGECTPNPCPVQVSGACCQYADDFTWGVCNVVTPALCLELGGVYQGNNVPCVPNPCHPIPTEVKSWGQIKSSYR